MSDLTPNEQRLIELLRQERLCTIGLRAEMDALHAEVRRLMAVIAKKGLTFHAQYEQARRARQQRMIGGDE